MFSDLVIGQDVEIVVKDTYKVVKETTGILKDIRTYEAHCKENNRHKVIYYNSASNAWEALPKQLAIPYYDEKERLIAEQRFMNRKFANGKIEPRCKQTTRYDDYFRAGKHTVEEILPLLKGNPKHHKEKEYIVMDGVNVKVTSSRYLVFKNSITCVHCKLAGTFFAVEKRQEDPGTNYHFNLYGIDVLGREVLFTKDHITPLCKGGRNHKSNYQTMCLPCNNLKGNLEIMSYYNDELERKADNV